jgi:4-amino-4-deoxy-L-arabinose transferase-like glycosyltransferase
VVQYIVKYKRYPVLSETMLAFHPPLYYLLAAPLWQLAEKPKLVQSLSLLFSIVSLLVLYKIIYKTDLIRGANARLYSFLLACFLPQFIMFGLYISNDTLTILLGCLTAWQVHRYIQSPGWRQAAWLALVTGVGLLTKMTFLVFVPILAVLVVFVEMRSGRSLTRVAGTTALFLALTAGVGGYKFVDNYFRYHDPLINSLDTPQVWATQQKLSYRGLRSFVDVNLLRLLAAPSVSETTIGSYPVILYGTFWYQYITESNFVGNVHWPYYYLGSLIYLVALVPTGVFLIGLVALVRRLARCVTAFDPRQPEQRRVLSASVAAALLLANFAMVVATLIRYHVWALMQGRYLFPTLVGFLAVFSVGVEIVTRSRTGAATLKVSMIALVGLFGLYLSSEIGYLMMVGSHPGIKSFLKSLA